MFRHSLLAVASAAAVLFGQMAVADTVTVATARGEVAVPKAPARVAVFDVAAIDTLAALGVAPVGVPDNLYVDYLQPGDATPIGTLFEPNLEAVATLAPDLIIVGSRSAAKFDDLAPLAPTIDMTIWEDLPAEARARLIAYGTIFDKEAKAQELAAAYDAKVEAVRKAAEGKGKALIVMTNGPKVSAYGKGSRFGWLHTAFDIPEAFENLNPETHGDSISFEFIAETNPDWLIVIDRGAATGDGASAAATLDNDLVKGTTAAQKGQIIYLKPAPVYIAGGGYSSVMGTMDELLAAFSK